MEIPHWPEEFIPNSLTWRLEFNTKVFTSTVNNSERSAQFQGARWVGTMNFKNLTRGQIRRLKATLYSLSGMAGKFLLWDFTEAGRPTMGSPVSAQSDQSGTILLTSGWLPDSRVLEVGEYISINNELKLITKDAWSAANGLATLEFQPPLRKAVSQGDLLITDKPCGVFRLAKDTTGQFSIKPGIFGDVAIDVVESFYV